MSCINPFINKKNIINRQYVVKKLPNYSIILSFFFLLGHYTLKEHTQIIVVKDSCI